MSTTSRIRNSTLDRITNLILRLYPLFEGFEGFNPRYERSISALIEVAETLEIERANLFLQNFCNCNRAQSRPNPRSRQERQETNLGNLPLQTVLDHHSLQTNAQNAQNRNQHRPYRTSGHPPRGGQGSRGRGSVAPARRNHVRREPGGRHQHPVPLTAPLIHHLDHLSSQFPRPPTYAESVQIESLRSILRPIGMDGDSSLHSSNSDHTNNVLVLPPGGNIQSNAGQSQHHQSGGPPHGQRAQAHRHQARGGRVQHRGTGRRPTVPRVAQRHQGPSGRQRQDDGNRDGAQPAEHHHGDHQTGGARPNPGNGRGSAKGPGKRRGQAERGLDRNPVPVNGPAPPAPAATPIPRPPSPIPVVELDDDTQNVLQELEDILTTGEEGEGSSQGGGPEGIYTSSSTSPSMSEEYMPGEPGDMPGRATGWN